MLHTGNAPRRSSSPSQEIHLRPLLLEGMLLGTNLEGAVSQSIADHAGLLRAIEVQDAARARVLMDEHMSRSYSEWVAATRANREEARGEGNGRAG